MRVSFWLAGVAVGLYAFIQYLIAGLGYSPEEVAALVQPGFTGLALLGLFVTWFLLGRPGTWVVNFVLVAAAGICGWLAPNVFGGLLMAGSAVCVSGFIQGTWLADFRMRHITTAFTVQLLAIAILLGDLSDGELLATFVWAPILGAAGFLAIALPVLVHWMGRMLNGAWFGWRMR